MNIRYRSLSYLLSVISLLYRFALARTLVSSRDIENSSSLLFSGLRYIYVSRVSRLRVARLSLVTILVLLLFRI